MTPRVQALAFRIWQHCEPLEWNITIVDLATALGEPPSHIVGALRAKRWLQRVRSRTTTPPQFLISGFYGQHTQLEEIAHVQQLRQA